MRLYPTTKIESPQPVPFPGEVKKRRPWGKYLYLSLVLVAGVGLGRWGFAHFYYLESPGVLAGVEVELEAPINALIKSLPLEIGDRVQKGAPLVVLYDTSLQEKMTLQEGKLERLLAEEKREKKQLDTLIEERRSQLALAGSRARGRKEDLLGRIEVLALQEKNLRKKVGRLEDLFQQTKKLYQLEAASRPRFLQAKLLLEDSRAKLETTVAELKIARRKLKRLQEEILMQEKILRELPQRVKAKSLLPILAVRIKSARQRLALLRQSLQERELRAPLSGVVNQLFKKEGEVVTPGEPILSVIDPESLFVRAYFPQQEQTSLHLHEQVELLFDNGRREQGTISKFYPATGPLPPQFQERYQPPRQALIAEITSARRRDWPLTLGMRVQVRKRKF